MKNMGLTEAEEEARKLSYKLTCCAGLRNAVLISKLATKRLKRDLERQNKKDKS